jgi:predicted secreted protein
MLIIKCRKSNVSIIEDDVSDVAIWFNNRFERISRRVIEIWSVIDLMFAFFDDSRQKFIMILNSFDLFECSDIISIESNDFQHDADFDAIKFEVMIDSNIVNVAEDSQIVSDFESKLIKLSSDSILEFVMKNRS